MWNGLSKHRCFTEYQAYPPSLTLAFLGALPLSPAAPRDSPPARGPGSRGRALPTQLILHQVLELWEGFLQSQHLLLELGDTLDEGAQVLLNLLLSVQGQLHGRPPAQAGPLGIAGETWCGGAPDVALLPAPVPDHRQADTSGPSQGTQNQEPGVCLGHSGKMVTQKYGRRDNSTTIFHNINHTYHQDHQVQFLSFTLFAYILLIPYENLWGVDRGMNVSRVSEKKVVSGLIESVHHTAGHQITAGIFPQVQELQMGAIIVFLVRIL